MYKIILASGSPRRRELLTAVGVPFEVRVSNVDEHVDGELAPDLFVEQLSLRKAADVARGCDSDALVIGADTVVLKDGAILGKPADADDARAMLARLSGDTHEVLTGLSVVRNADAKCVSVCERTSVRFCPLTDAQIDRYVATGEPLDKAGAYGIQGLGSLLVSGIEGDYFNVVGLPLCRLARVLDEEFGIQLL